MPLLSSMTKTKKLFRIYILGNPTVKKDSFPFKILPELQEYFKKILFLQLDPTENFPEESHFICIDTILDIKEVKVLNDIDKIQSHSSYSLHDFDLGFSLKLMKKLGRLKKITIIGIPPFGDEKEIINQVKKVIANLLLKNE